MSDDNSGKPIWKRRDLQGMMKEVLSFGPENNPGPETQQQAQFSDRIKRIVEKLKELSRRIDQLSSQL